MQITCQKLVFFFLLDTGSLRETRKSFEIHVPVKFKDKGNAFHMCRSLKVWHDMWSRGRKKWIKLMIKLCTLERPQKKRERNRIWIVGSEFIAASLSSIQSQCPWVGQRIFHSWLPVNHSRSVWERLIRTKEGKKNKRYYGSRGLQRRLFALGGALWEDFFAKVIL